MAIKIKSPVASLQFSKNSILDRISKKNILMDLRYFVHPTSTLDDIISSSFLKDFPKDSSFDP